MVLERLTDRGRNRPEDVADALVIQSRGLTELKSSAVRVLLGLFD